MNVSNLVVAISAAVLLASGAAQAAETNKHNPHNQNFISKRPYHEPVTSNTSKTAEEFEGATLEQDENEKAAIKNLKVLRMNQISRRGYHEAN